MIDYSTFTEGRIDNETLRNLCIANDWFTCGTNDQYDKLFEMNAAGASIEHIATVIWLCSDSEVPENCRRDIIFALNEAGFTDRADISEKEHILDWMGI